MQELARIAGPRVLPIPAGRSPQWPKVRAAHLKVEPACMCCGGKRLLNVHHRKPYMYFPEMELWDGTNGHPNNLITLCEGANSLNCHLVIGHNLLWTAWNELVAEDAARFLKMLRSRAGVPWEKS